MDNWRINYKIKNKNYDREIFTVKSNVEVQSAPRTLIQEREFPVELNFLRKKQPLPTNCKYLSWNIFLDDKGVGGRLSKHRTFNNDQKRIYPNSKNIFRPLADPSDVRALTPGHFLIVPLLERTPYTKLSLSFRWQLVQETKQRFWK
ncbi:hypothetical protein TNCV_2906641 [Trichonephila clavipes]|nr:hypothetical protein TNCV_2906641 [Trichonephila clavipes]